MKRPDFLSWVDEKSHQLGRGIAYVWLLCLTAYFFGGEFPIKGHAMAAIAALYIAYVGAFSRRSRWQDVEGFLFLVVYGSWGTIFAFEEFAIGEPYAVFDIMGPAPIFGSFLAHLAIGIIARLRP